MNLPKWIKKIFKMLKCPHCTSALKESNVYGIGIRENAKKDQIELLFGFDYRCDKCKKFATFSGFKTTYDGFISDIMEISSHLEHEPQEIINNAPESTVKKRKKSCITDEEVESALTFLNECVSFDEFLHKLGVITIKEEKDENK